MGKPWAALVLLLDAFKGFVPVFVTLRCGCPHVIIALVMVAAVFGHVFSLFLGFRGGKGVATGLGVVAAVCWPAALVGVGVYVFSLAAFRVSALRSLAGTLTATIALWAMGSSRAYLMAMIVIGALIVWRHRENIDDFLR